ncbi:hypothetical protein KKC13_02585 [bacterium]|nr:hypothetical protein [bacterium]MBU1958966.1 hypothetical protein [bacterium]
MKEIVNLLQEKNLIFKSLRPIEPKTFGSRKKIEIYLGVDLKKYYACVLRIRKKSRILSKEAMDLMEFHKKLELMNKSKIKKKYIYIQAPLCSKAKALLQEEKWVVWHEE